MMSMLLVLFYHYSPPGFLISRNIWGLLCVVVRHINHPRKGDIHALTRSATISVF